MSKDAWHRDGDAGYRHFLVVEAAFKFSMTDAQASQGIHQQVRVETDRMHRKHIWRRYMDASTELPIGLPAEFAPDTRHGLHLLTQLLVESNCGLDRDAFIDAMHDRDIGPGVHYRSPPKHAYYQDLLDWRPEAWPKDMEFDRRTVSLPLSPALTHEDVECVVMKVRETLHQPPPSRHSPRGTIMTIKRIQGANDLAINGAPPAFEEPLHVGRPNIGDHERFLAMAGKILDSHWLTNNGPLVREFEVRIADMLGVRHCVAMCNGTVALEIAIRALGLEGEVIVPSWTFIATAHALHWQGITPVFADIDPATHNLDPDAVRRMTTPRTSGIIGVHLWGRPAPIDALQALADEHGLKLMFDAAHAFGCRHEGQSIGNFGACEVFSFHATKVFNSFEGGAVATNDDELAETMRLMRNFGFAGYDNVIHPGTNGKMPEINAAMGLTNLELFPAFVTANRERHQNYVHQLSRIRGVSVLEYTPEHAPNFQYVVAEISPDFGCTRDAVVEALQAENILARKYFWPGCHGMLPYRTLFPHAGLLLPRTSEVASRVIVLPTGSSLPEGCEQVVSEILHVLSAPRH